MNWAWLRRLDPRGEPHQKIWGADDRAPETLSTEDIVLGGQAELLRWALEEDER